MNLIDDIKSNNEICVDCVKRFCCSFNALIHRTACGLYESDTEIIRQMINSLQMYIDKKNESH